MTDKELLIRLRVESPELQAVNKQLDFMKEKIKVLMEVEKDNNGLTKIQTQRMAEAKDAAGQLIQQKQLLTAEETKLVNVQKTQEGSMARLRAETSLMVAQANTMVAKTTEETAARDALIKKIYENKEKIRDFDRSVSGSNTLIGEYTRGIHDAGGGLKDMFAGTAAGSIAEGFSTVAKGIGLVMGIIAGGAAIFHTFKEAIDSTGRTAGAFKDTMAGLKTGTEYFLKSLASVDFSGFWRGMGDAMRSGEEYSATLRNIVGQTRALGIAESEEHLRVEYLRRDAMDKTKTNDERIAKINEILVIEEELAARKKVLAERERDALIEDLSVVNKVTAEEINAYVRRDDKIMESFNRGKAIATEQKRLKDIESTSGSGNLTIASTGGSVLDATDYIKANKKAKESLSEVDKAALDLYNRLGNLTGEEQDKVAVTIQSVADAEKEGLSLTRRVYMRRQQMIAELMKFEIKSADDTADAKKKAEEEAAKVSEQGYENEILLQTTALKESYAKGEISANDYESKLVDIALEGARNRAQQLIAEGADETAMIAIRAKVAEYEVKAKELEAQQAKEALQGKVFVPMVGWVDKKEYDKALETQKANEKLGNEMQSNDEFNALYLERAGIVEGFIYKAMLSQRQAAIDEISDEKKKQKAIVDIQRDAARAKQAIEQQVTAIIGKVGELGAAKTAAAQKRQMDALDKREAQQLKAAGDNEEQKARIEKKYADDREALDLKFARQKRKQAIFQAIINGALAVGRAFADYKFPFSLIVAAISAIATGVQIATIKAAALAGGGRVGSRASAAKSMQVEHVNGIIDLSKGVPVKESEKGDNHLIYAKRGEVVLNEKQQNQLGGANTFRQIGVPGFAFGGRVGHMDSPKFSIPSLATGGLVGGGSSQIQLLPGNTFDMETMAEMLGNIINEKQVVLNLNDLDTASNDYNRVKTRAAL